MKRNISTPAIFLVLFLILFISCSKDDDKVVIQTSFTNQTTMSAQIDVISDDILNIIENQYNEQSNGEGRMPSTNITAFLPDCAIITTVSTGNTWQRTIDFGTTGCELTNGNTLQGKIIIDGTNNFEDMQQVLTYSLDNFYHNENYIEGNKYATRIASNANGNPQSTISLDLTITFVNGIVAERQGDRVWEWVAGVATPFNPFDNEYLVTGEWTTDFPNNTLTTEVNTPLRVKLSCPYIVEGVLSFSTNTYNALLDYGNGSCDNNAELSINGGTANIIILGN